MIQENKRHSRLQSFLDNPSKSMWTLAIPIITGMGIQTLYSLVDMFFIGKLGGEAPRGAPEEKFNKKREWGYSRE